MIKNQTTKNVYFTLINARENTVLIGNKSIHTGNAAKKWGFFSETFVSADDISDSTYRGLKKYLGVEHINGGEWSDRHSFLGPNNEEELAHFLMFYFDEIKTISLDQFNEVISALNLKWSVPLFADRVSGYDLISYWLNYSFQSEITISADRATVEKARTNLIALGSKEQEKEL